MRLWIFLAIFLVALLVVPRRVRFLWGLWVVRFFEPPIIALDYLLGDRSRWTRVMSVLGYVIGVAFGSLVSLVLLPFLIFMVYLLERFFKRAQRGGPPTEGVINEDCRNAHEMVGFYFGEVVLYPFSADSTLVAGLIVSGAVIYFLIPICALLSGGGTTRTLAGDIKKLAAGVFGPAPAASRII